MRESFFPSSLAGSAFVRAQTFAAAQKPFRFLRCGTCKSHCGWEALDLRRPDQLQVVRQRLGLTEQLLKDRVVDHQFTL